MATRTPERAPEAFRSWLARPDWFTEPFRAFFDGGEIRVEEYRDEDAYVVRAELPGIDPDEDVEITVDAGMLHIRAERRETHEDEGDRTYRSEFRYGAFRRTLPLPRGAREDDVEATYVDGVLTVKVPLAEDAEGTRKVKVTHG